MVYVFSLDRYSFPFGAAMTELMFCGIRAEFFNREAKGIFVNLIDSHATCRTISVFNKTQLFSILP